MITEAMWSRIEPLMPADPVRGRRWADHCRTLEAIAWKYCTNSPWRDLPDELGSFQTTHKRLIRWAVDGTWKMILTAAPAAADADDDIDWTVSVDSTVVRAHQHAARSTQKGATHSGEPADQALGRSRGGVSTKFHLAADGRPRPLAFTVTAGQAGNAPAFETVMSRIRVPRTGPGRPLAVLVVHGLLGGHPPLRPVCREGGRGHDWDGGDPHPLPRRATPRARVAGRARGRRTAGTAIAGRG